MSVEPARTLYIAAGGSADALACVMLAHKLDPDQPAWVATLAWDRLLIDPLPGPRCFQDFTGLAEHQPGVMQITAVTQPIAPSGSTLPLLAKAVSGQLFLLDPAQGAIGLADQFTAIATHVGATNLAVVDVGGDMVSGGSEPGLNSPLADYLTLAATTLVSLPSKAVVCGIGLDGELTETEAFSRFTALGMQQELTLNAADVLPFRQIFDWHPSEANGMVTLAALGHRGSVESRDSGRRVSLTEYSASVYSAQTSRVAAGNHCITALRGTESFAAAEQTVRGALGFTELDYERVKAKRITNSNVDAALLRLDKVCTAAATRGVRYLTLRRLACLLGIQEKLMGVLMEKLKAHDEKRCDPPLWRVTPH